MTMTAKIDVKKVSVVTGASRGIGLETARRLHGADYVVYGLSRTAQHEGGFFRLACDVGNEAEVGAALAQVLECEGRLDLLVCNAGFGISGAVEDTEPAQAEQQFTVNFFGAFLCIKNALPALRQSGGRIILVSSLAGVLPIPFQAFYSASKAALNALALALADELKPFGVSVCAVLPGDVRTGFTAAREKQTAEASCYGSTAEASVRKMERDEQNGLSAAYVARQIDRIAQKRRIRPFYVSGRQYQLFYMLQKLLPLRLVRLLVRKLYAK